MLTNKEVLRRQFELLKEIDAITVSNKIIYKKPKLDDVK